MKGHSFFSRCVFLSDVFTLINLLLSIKCLSLTFEPCSQIYQTASIQIWLLLLIHVSSVCDSYWWQKYPPKPLPHSAHMATLLFWGTLRCWITSLIMPGEGCFSDGKQFLTVLLFLNKRHNCTEDIVNSRVRCSPCEAQRFHLVSSEGSLQLSSGSVS